MLGDIINLYCCMITVRPGTIILADLGWLILVDLGKKGFAHCGGCALQEVSLLGFFSGGALYKSLWIWHISIWERGCLQWYPTFPGLFGDISFYWWFLFWILRSKAQIFNSCMSNFLTLFHEIMGLVRLYWQQKFKSLNSQNEWYQVQGNDRGKVAHQDQAIFFPTYINIDWTNPVRHQR
jgi:hypothetical protein